MAASPSPFALLLRQWSSCEHLPSPSCEKEQEYEHEQKEDQKQKQDLWSLVRSEPSHPPPSDSFSPLVALRGGSHGSQSPLETYRKPYIHPDAKRRHELSDRSLQLCTEVLGSETGSYFLLSDYCFSASCDQKEDDEAKEEKEEEEEEEEEQKNCHSNAVVSHYNGLIMSSGVSRRSDGLWSVQNSGNAVAAAAAWPPLPYGSSKSQSRCFPPPLPSLSKSNDSSVMLRRVKEEGRFMLKPVTVCSCQKRLQAYRHGGRLQLRFVASLSLQNHVNVAAYPALAEVEK